jgi:glycosyltransferase involved in cell wall biosynthesis
MSVPVYVNGRFLRQKLTGVQRFATEITAAMARAASGPVVLVPPALPGGDAADPGFTYTRIVGHRHGQAWEQIDLPRHARDGVLINLGNTAPVRRRHQVVVIHDCGVFSTPDAYGWKFRTWYKVLQTLLVRAGARIVTVSEFSRREIVRHLGANPDRVSVMPEGADHMRRIPPEPECLGQAGLQPGRYVLAVGSLSAHKNLAALGVLARALENRGMVLAVTGGLDRAVFRSDSAAILPQPARYLGRVSDGALRALYQHAACLVFPSRYEGFGLPAIEAMACDCPLAVSDIAALRETCGDAAVYFDPDSPADIAGQTERLLDEPGLADRLRAAAASRLLKFTWDNAAASLASVVHDMQMAEQRQVLEVLQCAP